MPSNVCVPMVLAERVIQATATVGVTVTSVEEARLAVVLLVVASGSTRCN